MFTFYLVLSFLVGYCVGRAWPEPKQPSASTIPIYHRRGKRLIWTTWLKVFTGGGFPKYRTLPRIVRMRFSPYWKLRGITIYWLGHELGIVVGKDVHGLYQ